MLDRAGALISNRMYTEEEQQKLYKRTLIIVSISQMFGGAGLAAGITVGALLAQQMLGTDAFAGLPAAMFTLGSALAAFIVGKLSQRYGRRIGLATGFIVGGFGAIGVVMAALTNSIILLLISLLIYGAGTATNLFYRAFYSLFFKVFKNLSYVIDSGRCICGGVGVIYLKRYAASLC